MILHRSIQYCENDTLDLEIGAARDVCYALRSKAIQKEFLVERRDRRLVAREYQREVVGSRRVSVIFYGRPSRLRGAQGPR